MLKRTWIAPARTAVIAFGCWAALMQEPSSMASQVSRPWADVRSTSSWRDTFVQLLVPGSATQPSKAERIPAKTISLKTPAEPNLVSITAVSDPNTAETYVLPGSQVFVSRKTGMAAIQVAIGHLNVWGSYVRVPTTEAREAAAIAKFVAEFSPEKLAEFPMIDVKLTDSAPPDFFVRGSQYVAASIQAIDVENGLLPLDLRNYAGRVGTFWIDPETWKVTRTEFSGRPSTRHTGIPVPESMYLPAAGRYAK